MAEKKYTKAKLVHHNYNLEKRWWVTFYAYDPTKDKKVRKRLFDSLNKLTTVSARLQHGEFMVQYINRELAQGKTLPGEVAKQATINFRKMSLIELIEWVRDQKESKKYRKGYTKKFGTIVTALEKWYANDHLLPLQALEFNSDYALQFFEYLRKVKKLENKTLNNYRNDFATVINFVEKKKPGTFKRNPLESVELLPTVTKKHAAFSDDQLGKILAYCKENHQHDQFLLFIQFIYYTLARPKEIRALRIHDLDLVNKRIYFRGENAKGKVDEYVPILPDLLAIIQGSGLLDLPGEWMVFGNKHCPGPKKINDNYFWQKNAAMLEALNIVDKDYTLYGYKHTGAVAFYRSTKDIKLIQFMCRHRTIEQANTYLRDLGELSNFEGLKNFKGAL